MRQWELFAEWLEKRSCLCQAEAEDILHDCLVRLLQHFLKENPDASEAEMGTFLEQLPDSLLFCVLKRELYNRRRARKREQEAISKWVACHMHHDDPEAEAMERSEEDFLISQLPEPAREIVLLWKAGCRWKEIAKQLGLSVSAVKMRFSRAMDALHEKLGVRCDNSAVCGVNMVKCVKRYALRKLLVRRSIMNRSKRWLKMSAMALVVANVVAMPNTLPALTGASKKAPTTTTIQDRDTLPFSGTARIPVLLFEPDGPITIHFLPSLRELLYPEEELVITPANCKVLSQTDTDLEIMPTYEDGSNQGYIYFHARNRSSREMRFLGSIHFASSKLPVDSDDDLWIDPKSIRDLAVMVDEDDRPFASIGFPSVGNLGWVLFKHSDFGGAAPDRERRGSRLPKWAEAELKFPPGTRRSALPRSALPKRPSDCSGFVDGRQEVEGDWITIGSPRLKETRKVGSISSGGNSTHSFTLCGKAASKFLAELGIRVPLPGGRPINILRQSCTETGRRHGDHCAGKHPDNLLTCYRCVRRLFDEPTHPPTDFDRALYIMGKGQNERKGYTDEEFQILKQYALNHPKATVRYVAITAFIFVKDERQRREALQILHSLANTTQDTHVLHGAIASIGDLGNKEDGDRILSFLKHPDPEIRAITVLALAKIGAQEHRRFVESLAQSERVPDVRETIREALQRWGGSRRR